MISFCPKDSSASIAAAAGEAPTALQLLVGPAAASPAASAAASTGAVPVGPLLTRLAVVRGCSDASWLSHTPDRFVALLENGTACQLFDGKSIDQKGGSEPAVAPGTHPSGRRLSPFGESASEPTRRRILTLC